MTGKKRGNVHQMESIHEALFDELALVVLGHDNIVILFNSHI